MFEVRLLGQFSLRLQGRPVELSSRPAQSLLAYLLLNQGASQRRERLAGLLWPDSNEANARRNLRQALWQIRRALGPAADSRIHADDLTIQAQLQPGDWLDVAQVQQPVDETVSADALIERVTAYLGELLPGFYDDWAVLERERLHALVEQTMHRLLDLLVEQTRWAELLHWAEQWIAQGYTPEPAYRALMLAHAAQGDMAAVAEVYRRCVDALARDLDVEPSPQTQALFAQLRRGETPAGPPVAAATLARRPIHPPILEQPNADERGPARHNNLPVHLTSFIGRTREIETIRTLLREHRLVTLTGSGGVGKTRLALETVRTLLEASPPTEEDDLFRDGVWLVELGAVTDAAAVSQTVGSVLGVREELCCPLAQSIVEYLRDKRALLILDNCEHLIEAVAHLVHTLLRACPNLKVLTTSREMLGVLGEMVMRAPSLSVPDPDAQLPAPTLMEFEAIRLFVERAVAVRPDFQFGEHNAATIVQICRQLDGVPLAIELAAARVRSMTPDQIRSRLADRFRLLTGGSRTALPRQQTLRALIDWSWHLLSPAERTLLRRLAIFRGGWTLEAAEAICADSLAWAPGEEAAVGGAGLDHAEILDQAGLLDLLTHLVDKSLVVVHEYSAEVRYDLLESIRQYALESLINANESAIMRANHLAFYLQLAEEAEPQLRTGKQLIWLARLEVEHDNLRTALEWAIDQPTPEQALRLAGALARFWYLRGYWNEGRHWLRTALNRGEGHNNLAVTRARIKALAGAGWLADEDGSDIPFYSEALALARSIGDRWHEAFSLRGLAAVTTDWANLAQAGPQLDASLAIFTELADPWGMALVRFNLGWLALERDDTAQAEAVWQAGLEQFRRCGDRWGIAVTVGALGYVARLRGDYTRASAYMHEGLQQFRELGDKAGVALSLTRLGNLAFRRSDYREASALLSESMNVLQTRHDMQSIIATRQVQGVVAAYQGNYEQAQALLQESIDYAQERNVDFEVAMGMSYLAFTHYLQADLARAEQLFQAGLALFERDQDREGVAFAQHGLALIALRTGDYAQAAARLEQSLARYQAWGDQRYIADVLDAQGRLALAQGDCAGARRSFGASLHLRRLMADKHGIAESLERHAGCDLSAAVSVRLLAAAETLRHIIGAPLPPIEREEHTLLLDKARQTLGEQAFAALWAEGQTLSIEQALALVEAQLVMA